MSKKKQISTISPIRNANIQFYCSRENNTFHGAMNYRNIAFTILKDKLVKVNRWPLDKSLLKQLLIHKYNVNAVINNINKNF